MVLVARDLGHLALRTYNCAMFETFHHHSVMISLSKDGQS
jgi:hypothetical protein